MGREDVNASLKGQDPGTTIIRFSESHYGQFAIAYTGTEKPTNIKHYLVQATEYGHYFNRSLVMLCDPKEISKNSKFPLGHKRSGVFLCISLVHQQRRLSPISFKSVLSL